MVINKMKIKHLNQNKFDIECHCYPDSCYCECEECSPDLYQGLLDEAINNNNESVQSAQRAENELKLAEANAKIKFVQAKANKIKSNILL